ncbi:hypothetical protein [Mycolicibacterium peregrinum]|uniref:hypothetical protein n=1 Tax=Mycolicibacterium peregrinum TaxID=43304 RepID=UPI001056AE6E|nr:hypothetical protein [Mycolicibacterium peregrinum]
MNPLALLSASVVAGGVIAVVINHYLRRTAPTPQRYSLRTHIFSAITVILIATAVGISAILDPNNRAVTIPFSVVFGLTGIVLLVRRTKELNNSTKEQ